MIRRVAALAAAAALSACAKGTASAPKDAGEAYYRALNCRACHRVADAGAGRGGPDLTMVGFRKSAAWLDAWLKDPQAWKPDTLMPNPRLNDQSRGAIVKYLASLKGEAWDGRRPWNEPALLKDPVERGHLLFARAGCVTCHGVGGKGGYPNNNVAGGKIPALAAVSQTYTKEELKRKIARGVVPQKADPAGPEPLLRMPAWGETLKDDELDAVVEYLWTLKPGAGAAGQDW